MKFHIHAQATASLFVVILKLTIILQTAAALTTSIISSTNEQQLSTSPISTSVQPPPPPPQANGECGASHPCQNGGTCLEYGANNFTCSCPKGFAGPYCSEDVNECLVQPSICKNGATCYNQFGGYQCICVNGWAGHDCNENVDDCVNAPCAPGAKCRDGVGYYFCECPPGKTGLLCQLDDGCHNNPCFGEAKCDTMPVDGRASCICPSGYTGELCNVDIDECQAGSPCEHDGICVNTPGSFKCECPRGFKGSRCEINIDECQTNPCENEGTCLDEKGGYKCICPPGYAGSRCQTDIDECAPNPCHNGAVCKDYVNSYRCLCQPGYWGERCEYPANKSPEYIKECEFRDCEAKSKNGKCDQECNLRICNFDGGDCALGAGNPWSRCLNYQSCFPAFKNGVCDQECNIPECFYDGGDCQPPAPADKRYQPASPNQQSNSNQQQQSRTCDEKSDHCLKHYANNICDDECNTEECGWDGGDCEMSINDMRSMVSTEAQGLLVITVEPAIKIGNATDVRQNIDLARMLTRISATTKTILKLQNLRQVDEGRGTMIELIADNRKCQSSCYNNTELIAAFLRALKSTDKSFERTLSPDALKITHIGYSNQSDGSLDHQATSATSLYMIMLGSLAAVCALLMVISVGSKQKVKNTTLWFPEGFNQVLSSRIKDPSGASRKVSSAAVARHNNRALYAIGGRLLGRKIKSEKTSNISIDPNGGIHSTELERATTPNGGGIYHEVYDDYDAYSTQDHNSVVEYVENPLTPPVMRQDPANIEGPHGMTPLMVASIRPPKNRLGLVAYGTTGEVNRSADSNVTELLEQGAQLNSSYKDTGETPLHFAARYGMVDNARALLERCDARDVNARDRSGQTPLHSAIGGDSMGVFELLIRCRGTDLNAQTNDGTTPLIWAVRLNIPSMIEELIHNECEVTRSDEKQKTALHWAAATDNVDAIRCLLSVKETNKDAQDYDGETPLFLAAREGAKQAVELLLSHNANIDINDNTEKSPLKIAKERKHHDIVRLLEEHDPPTPKSMTSIHHPSSRQMTPVTPRSVTSVHNNNNNPSSRQTTPFSPGADKFSYNVPCLNNYITKLPESPYSLESTSSPPEQQTIVGAYNEQQYQIPANHPNSLSSQNQAGVFV